MRPETPRLRYADARALAYQEYKAAFKSAAFAPLAARGARPQFILWAGTGTQNPAYSDMTLGCDVGQARQQFSVLGKLDVDMDQVGEELQVEGVKLFAQAFELLLGLMAEKQ
ncbi:MAG: hypothetical protein Q8K18_13715 [Burkholderiales bacterium]|nr:hypothetical protein [Burkholderiales bacterium]